MNLLLRFGRTALAVAGLLPALASLAAPADDHRFDLVQTWRDTRVVSVQPTDHGPVRVSSVFQLRARLFVLMGEPIVYCVGSWRLESVHWFEGFRVDPKQAPREAFFQAQTTPEKAWRDVELASAKLAFPLRKAGGESLHLPCDPGVFYGNGNPQASFNVPGSDSWDRTVFNGSAGLYAATAEERWARGMYTWLGGADLRRLMKDGQLGFVTPRDGSTGMEVMPLKLEYNLAPLAALVRDKAAQETQAALQAQRMAARKPADAADPLEQMFAAVEDRQHADSQEALRRTERQAAERQASATAERRRRMQAQLCGGNAAEPPFSAADDTASARLDGWKLCRTGKLVAFRDKGGKYGYKDADGTVRIEPRFDQARDFSEGLGAVAEQVRGDRKWGFVNAEGRVVVPLNYSSVRDFKDGRASVEGDVLQPGSGCGTRYTIEVGTIDVSGRLVEPMRGESRPVYCPTIFLRSNR